MKKFCLPLFIIMTMLSHNAWGACTLQSRDNEVKNNNTLWIDGQEGVAYVCSENHRPSDCRNNAVVFVPQYSKVWHYTTDDINSGATETEGPAYCTCWEGGETNDRWECEKDISLCPNSPLQAMVDGAEMIYTTAGQFDKSSTKTQLNGMNTISTTTGGTPCYVYVCKDGKIVKDGACVENTDKNNCESTGGTWQDGSSKCDCSGNSDLEEDGDKKCKCINKGGQSYRWSGSACVTVKGGYTYGEVQTANANWQNTQTANKQACEASGGTYSNSKCSCTAENTSPQGGVCACVSGYKWKNESNKKDGCEPTDNTMVELACKAAADKGQAQWQSYPSPGRCECKENGYDLDVNARECKPNEQRAICQPLMNANKARWDTVTGTCVCSQAGYELVGNECVETEEAATARKDKEMKSAKNKIEDVHSKLKRVQDGFKVSAWKNEEGKFNTARLASDSIAGVVLGTTGALVTSKVVKKNQVENGFEDIQCTIGGQAVAQWGDDFSVGTQF